MGLSALPPTPEPPPPAVSALLRHRIRDHVGVAVIGRRGRHLRGHVGGRRQAPARISAASALPAASASSALSTERQARRRRGSRRRGPSASGTATPSRASIRRTRATSARVARRAARAIVQFVGDVVLDDADEARPWLTRHSARLSFSRIKSQKSLRYGWSASWSIVSRRGAPPSPCSSPGCSPRQSAPRSRTPPSARLSLSSQHQRMGQELSSVPTCAARPRQQSDDAGGRRRTARQRESSLQPSSCGAANLSPIRGRFGRCAGASAAIGDSSPR